MFAEILVAEEDFEIFDWETVIKDVAQRDCESYSRVFFAASQQKRESGETKQADILLLFHGLTSMMLKPSEKSQPFAPMMVMNGSRTADISDFSNQQINIIKLWLPKLKDTELKARIADVAWTLRSGNYESGKMAVENYLASAKILLESEFAFRGIERIIRAAHLSISLGRNEDTFRKTIFEVESLIDQYSQSNADFMSELMELLLEYRQGSPAKYSLVAESMAIFEETKKNWYVSRRYWEIKAKWHRMEKDSESETATLKHIVLNFTEEANEVIQQGRGYMVAAHHIQSAIEILRKIPGTKDQQNELHKTLLAYQEKSMAEMGSISGGEIELTEPIERAIEQIKGKNIFDAILTLSLLASPATIKYLEGYVEEITKTSPLYSFIGKSLVDERGRKIGQKPAMLLGTPEEMAEGKEAEMQAWASRFREMDGVIIHAVRIYFTTEHNPTIKDILEIVSHNPFVPSGREMIYAQGILFGLEGKYLNALHLLIPQIENSIRSVLNNEGIITTSLSPEGIQAEIELKSLLKIPKLAEIFGKDLVFDLQGLLVSREGANFRNLFAHGLLDHDDFYSYQAIYLWCMTLRLCCLPIILSKSRSAKSETVV